MDSRNDERGDEERGPRKDAPPANRSGEDRKRSEKGTEQPREYPDMIDDTLDDTFPASDAPSWSGQ